MKYDSFEKLLQQAISGDVEAMNEVLLLYEPLINRNSVIDGKFDEDCRQYIMLQLVKRIGKFKI